MNAADQLRQELASSSLFDKEKLLATVTNGIKKNGGISEIWMYHSKSGVRYGSYDIECGLEEGEAIATFLRKEGFIVRNMYHPVSGHWSGYQATL